jgi:hypothetical protein
VVRLAVSLLPTRKPNRFAFPFFLSRQEEGWVPSPDRSWRALFLFAWRGVSFWIGRVSSGGDFS